jgi:hypothetical protein
MSLFHPFFHFKNLTHRPREEQQKFIKVPSSYTRTRRYCHHMEAKATISTITTLISIHPLKKLNQRRKVQSHVSRTTWNSCMHSSMVLDASTYIVPSTYRYLPSKLMLHSWDPIYLVSHDIRLVSYALDGCLVAHFVMACGYITYEFLQARTQTLDAYTRVHATSSIWVRFVHACVLGSSYWNFTPS